MINIGKVFFICQAINKYRFGQKVDRIAVGIAGIIAGIVIGISIGRSCVPSTLSKPSGLCRNIISMKIVLLTLNVVNAQITVPLLKLETAPTMQLLQSIQ